MKQTTFATTGFELVTKRTRKDEFLEEMSPIVLWSELLAMIQTFAPANKTRRPPFPTFTLLRLTYLQQWFGLSDPAMEEAFYDMVLFRELAQLDSGLMLKADTEVGDTLIAAPSSTKISTRKSDHEMHQAQKGNQWRFGMKVLICAASESGLVHTARVRLLTNMTSRRITLCCMAKRTLRFPIPAAAASPNAMRSRPSTPRWTLKWADSRSWCL